jgi:hypothetical protein
MYVLTSPTAIDGEEQVNVTFVPKINVLVKISGPFVIKAQYVHVFFFKPLDHNNFVQSLSFSFGQMKNDGQLTS